MSLLLLALFAALGTGGARPGGFTIPGMAGAAPMRGTTGLLDSFPMIGAERSLVTAFLSLAPFVISVNRAP